jgi:hypothetical protein
MPSAKQTRRTAQRPALPRSVPEELPGWSWAQNAAGELALVAPGGESTAWFLRNAEARALAQARSYVAQRPQLRTCRAEAAAVAQLGWVARALPAAGWELHPRGAAQSRVALDDAGLHTAAAMLLSEPGLTLRALATELTAAGEMVALVGDDLAPDDLAALCERAAALGAVVEPPEEPGGRCRVVSPAWDGRQELRLSLDDLAQQIAEWETAAASRAGVPAISAALLALVERARALGAVVDVLDGVTLHVLPPERVGGVDLWLTPEGLERLLGAWEAPAKTVQLELPAFDQRAFQQEWSLVQQALDDIGAAATLALLHAAQARLSEVEGHER